MPRPDFVVIGAMKCGTSTVCACLEDHPETCMLPRCEPDFFSRPEVFARGADWYEALFHEARPGQAIGEGSNSYSAGALFPGTAERIARYRPDMRIVCMVRDPMVRMVSAWVRNRVDSGDAVPARLDDALRTMPDTYLDQSLYWKTLSLYRDHFPDSRIFVGFLEYQRP